MKIVPSSSRRHYAARVSIFLILAALIAGMPGSCGVGGNDTHPSENLEIRDWYDLDAVRNNLAGHHTLMNDLDSTTLGYEELASPTANGGKGWQPIGYLSISCACGPGVAQRGYGLTGTFDGQGYEIHDLFINRPDEPHVGLFGLVDEGAIIKNVGLVRATVTGEGSVGGLVGYHVGIVSNSYFSGNVTGDEYVGGLLGVNTGTVSNCYSTGSVTGDGYVGGLVGMNFESRGTVSDSFWDTETSGQATSAGGMGKSTAEMKDIATFSGAGWNITTVAPGETNPAYIWNIIDNVTYPFLS